MSYENAPVAKTLRIRVVTTAYEGNVPFPESDYYPDFVATRLSEMWQQFDVSVEVGPRIEAWIYGVDDTDVEAEMTREIKSLVKIDLWDAFCAHGYAAFSFLSPQL